MILLQVASPSIQLTDQGLIAFCMLLLAIFGALFAMELRHAERTTRMHTDIEIFKVATEANFQLLHVQMGETRRVGIFHALEVLEEPNPWTPEEMAIRDRMHRNPTLSGITTTEILTVIRRLDEEVDSGTLYGDKLLAARYMLRELNGELKRREEESLTSQSFHIPQKPSVLRWLLGK